MSIYRKALAEFVGTFWLVFAGCGSILISAYWPHGTNTSVSMGVGLLGVALSFGLAVLTMAYAVGHISGGHFNPAVSTGLVFGGRFPAVEWLPYVLAQLFGSIAAVGLLQLIGTGMEGFSLADTCNGYGDHSPKKFPLMAGAVVEFTMTFIFLIVILGATDSRAPAGFAPIPIGLVLTLIIIVGGPVTNLSVNPARSTGPALAAGGWALEQLWLFWAAPMAGAAAAGLFYRVMAGGERKP